MAKLDMRAVGEALLASGMSASQVASELVRIGGTAPVPPATADARKTARIASNRANPAYAMIPAGTMATARVNACRINGGGKPYVEITLEIDGRTPLTFYGNAA